MPDLEVPKWVIYAPIPSKVLDCQSNITAALSAPGTNATAVIVTEKGPLGQQALCLVVNGRTASDLPVKVDYSADLSAVRVRPGASQAPVPPLSEKDWNLYTAAASPDNPDDCMDFNTPAVKAFIEAQGLSPLPNENEIQYGVRALTWIINRYHYRSDNQDRHVSALLKEDWGDCGSFANIFVGIMRAAGYPARTKWGLMAHSATAGFGHVRTELWINSIGWVTVDVAQAVTSKDPLGTFGYDPGDVIYTWVDTGPQLPSPMNVLAHNQFFELPISQMSWHGDAKPNLVVKDNWTVSQK